MTHAFLYQVDKNTYKKWEKSKSRKGEFELPLHEVEVCFDCYNQSSQPQPPPQSPPPPPLLSPSPAATAAPSLV